MTGRERWTRPDDRAVAEHTTDWAIAEALRPVIAHRLGIPLEQVRIAAVHRARPCRHWRCRARRWWKRMTP